MPAKPFLIYRPWESLSLCLNSYLATTGPPRLIRKLLLERAPPEEAVRKLILYWGCGFYGADRVRRSRARDFLQQNLQQYLISLIACMAHGWSKNLFKNIEKIMFHLKLWLCLLDLGGRCCRRRRRAFLQRQVQLEIILIVIPARSRLGSKHDTTDGQLG